MRVRRSNRPLPGFAISTFALAALQIAAGYALREPSMKNAVLRIGLLAVQHLYFALSASDNYLEDQQRPSPSIERNGEVRSIRSPKTDTEG